MVEVTYDEMETFYPFNVLIIPSQGRGQERGEEERKYRPIKSSSGLLHWVWSKPTANSIGWDGCQREVQIPPLTGFSNWFLNYSYCCLKWPFSIRNVSRIHFIRQISTQNTTLPSMSEEPTHTTEEPLLSPQVCRVSLVITG